MEKLFRLLHSAKEICIGKVLMTIYSKEFVQEKYKKTTEWKKVLEISKRFIKYLSLPEIGKQIDTANQPGNKSQEMEKVINPIAEDIGFKSQKKGLFKDYELNLRPDYYLPLDQTGIIIEVERGQTTQNNADIKDFWKVHIVSEANYLFLFVPNYLRQTKNNPTLVRDKTYDKVIKRMTPFFKKDNYTNVRGLVMLGYGK